MPKIRGIKPEFWTDEDICELPAFARLLFIGMWNYACDNGHLQDKPKQIKRRILPDDDVNATELLRELEAKGLVERADGWITIPNLTHHQKVDRRYFTACDKDGCEPPDETVSQRAARRAPAVRTPGTPSAHTDRTPGALVDGDGDGDGEKKKTSSSSGPRKRGTRLPEGWIPSEVTRKKLIEKFSHVDLKAEHEKFTDYWQAKAGREAIKVDWDATFRNWIRTAAERQPARPLRAVSGREPALVLNEHAPDPGPPTW